MISSFHSPELQSDRRDFSSRSRSGGLLLWLLEELPPEKLLKPVATLMMVWRLHVGVIQHGEVVRHGECQSGDRGVDRSGHIALSTAYKRGAAPPMYENVNTVQSGLLAIEQFMPLASQTPLIVWRSRCAPRR